MIEIRARIASEKVFWNQISPVSAQAADDAAAKVIARLYGQCAEFQLAKLSRLPGIGLTVLISW